MDQDNRSNAEKTPEENKAAEFRLPERRGQKKAFSLREVRG
ncbi:MAG: hypothetical protein ACLRSW_03745 [Christensenellaceae bacterium]